MTINMTQLRHCLKANIAAQIPTMIWGKPGVGKSDLVKQLAAEYGAEMTTRSPSKRGAAMKPADKFGLIDFRATLRDPVDMRGLPLIDAKSGTTRWLAPNELPNAARDGEQGILFMDELPQASTAMQAACFSLVLDRYIGEYHLPPGWIVLAAGNRASDRSGASRMLKALANRFAHYEVEPDIESWSAWAARTDLNPLVAAFVRFRPALLHAMPEGEENAFPTPRAWGSVAKIADEKDPALRLQLVQAIVGEGAALEFEAFVRVWSRLPSIDQIFRDPKGVAVPSMSEPALIFAVSTAISRRVTKATLTNALIYAKRLPKEFEIMAVIDAVRRDPSLKETKAFGQWFSDKQEMMI